jgi:hypothetical protein
VPQTRTRTLARQVTIAFMRRDALAISITLALLVAHPFPAAACSVGPDFYPRDHTQLLVLGRARSIELGARTAIGYIEATVILDVIHVYRGATASPLRFVDSRSVIAEPRPPSGRVEIQFVGSGGGCGTMDEDPVGKYVLIALARGDDARWHANLIYGAIYTVQPEYTMYRWVFERHGVALPFLITGPVPDVGTFGPALSP